MQLSDRDNFYEKIYFHEIAERNRLDDRFRTLLAIVAIVFSLLGYLFNQVVLGMNLIPLLFWLVYSLAIVSFGAAIVCYTKAWHSQHYKTFPLLVDMERYIETIQHFYDEQTDAQTARQWTQEAFSQYMRGSFIEHASFNASANDNKRFWLYYGNSFIVACFVFAVMSSLPVAEHFVR